jgi:hypothetical protein
MRGLDVLNAQYQNRPRFTPRNFTGGSLPSRSTPRAAALTRSVLGSVDLESAAHAKRRHRVVLRPLRLCPFIEIGRTDRFAHDAGGEVGEAHVVVPGVCSQSIERFIHIATRRLADHPLRLFDDDSTIQGVVQLGVQCGGIDRRTVLKDGDGRYVGETLGDQHVFVGERALMRAKEVERSNCPAPQTHGQAMNGPESLSQGARSEQRPSAIGFTQRVVRDGESVAKAIDARALVRLDLEELENGHRLTR